MSMKISQVFCNEKSTHIHKHCTGYWAIPKDVGEWDLDLDWTRLPCRTERVRNLHPLLLSFRGECVLVHQLQSIYREDIFLSSTYFFNVDMNTFKGDVLMGLISIGLISIPGPTKEIHIQLYTISLVPG